MNHLLFSLPLALCLLGSLSAAAGDSLRVVKGQVSNYYIPVVNEYQLTGRVTDGSGKPLQGATVMFFASPVHCNTDAQGRFSLKATDADLHLYIYYPGMKMSNLMRTKNQREVSVVMAPGRADAGEDGPVWCNGTNVGPRREAQVTPWYDPRRPTTTTYCNPLNISYNYEPYNNNVKAGDASAPRPTPWL